MPQLGAINYSPILQGSLAAAEGQMRGSEAVARGLASFGAQVGKGVEQYFKNKDERETLTTLIESKSQRAIRLVPQLQNIDADVTGLQNTVSKLEDLPKMSLAKLRAINAELDVTIADADKSYDRAIQTAQLARLNQQIAEADQAKKNREAAMSAYMATTGQVGDTITTPTVRPSLINAGVAPQARGPSFVPTDIYNEMFPRIAEEQQRARQMQAEQAAMQPTAPAPVQAQQPKTYGFGLAKEIKGVVKGAVSDFLGKWDYLGGPGGVVVYRGNQPEKVGSLEAQPGQQKPITEFVGDAAVSGDSFSKKISGSKFAMSVLDKNPEVANMVAQTISQKVMRDMSPSEKRDAFIRAYAEGGGVADMEFLRESKKLFGGEISVVDVGGLGKALFVDGEFKAFAGLPKPEAVRKTATQLYDELLVQIDALEKSGRPDFTKADASKAREYAKQKYLTGRPIATGMEQGFATFLGAAGASPAAAAAGASPVRRFNPQTNRLE